MTSTFEKEFAERLFKLWEKQGWSLPHDTLEPKIMGVFNSVRQTALKNTLEWFESKKDYINDDPHCCCVDIEEAKKKIQEEFGELK